MAKEETFKESILQTMNLTNTWSLVFVFISKICENNYKNNEMTKKIYYCSNIAKAIVLRNETKYFMYVLNNE